MGIDYLAPLHNFLSVPAKGIIVHRRAVATDVLWQVAVETTVRSQLGDEFSENKQTKGETEETGKALCRSVLQADLQSKQEATRKACFLAHQYVANMLCFCV